MVTEQRLECRHCWRLKIGKGKERDCPPDIINTALPTNFKLLTSRTIRYISVLFEITKFVVIVTAVGAAAIFRETGPKFENLTRQNQMPVVTSIGEMQ